MIKSIGYDLDHKILEIEFSDKTIYHYYSVPPNIHNNLMKASSHGKYFHRHIKKRYRYKKLK